MILKLDDLREANKQVFKMNVYQECLSLEELSEKIIL
jgi:hypothetical protein